VAGWGRCRAVVRAVGSCGGVRMDEYLAVVCEYRGCGRPLTSLCLGGPDPAKQPERRELLFSAVTWCFEPADQISACPAAPADGRDRVSPLIVGAMMQEAEDEPLFAGHAAGIDIAKAGIEVTIRVPSDTRRGGRQQETRSFRTTRKELLALAGWLRCWQVTKVGMESTELLEAGVLPAGGRGPGLRAVPRRAGQGAARTPEDRQAGLCLAGEDHRAGLAARQLRAPGRDPQAAHPHPLPAAPDPGPHRREAAGGEAAGGAPEAVQRDLRHPRGLRPGHAGGHRRRGTQPQDAGPSSPAAPCAARSPSSKRPSTVPS
jgi:hypothetical protein